MVDNQHRQISGYRDLSQDDIDLMNEMKKQERDMLTALEAFEKDERFNKRSLAIARTNLQTGYMWLIRALARPNGE